LFVRMLAASRSSLPGPLYLTRRPVTSRYRIEGCCEMLLSHAVGPPSHPSCMLLVFAAGGDGEREAGFELARPGWPRFVTFRTLSVSTGVAR